MLRSPTYPSYPWGTHEQFLAATTIPYALNQPLDELESRSRFSYSSSSSSLSATSSAGPAIDSDHGTHHCQPCMTPSGKMSSLFLPNSYSTTGNCDETLLDDLFLRLCNAVPGLSVKLKSSDVSETEHRTGCLQSNHTATQVSCKETGIPLPPKDVILSETLTYIRFLQSYANDTLSQDYGGGQPLEADQSNFHNRKTNAQVIDRCSKALSDIGIAL